MTEIELLDWINTGLNGGGLGLAGYVVFRVFGERNAAWEIFVAILNELQLDHLRHLVPRQFHHLFDN